jgi:hypothetical protein
LKIAVFGWILFGAGVVQVPFWALWAFCKYYKTSIFEVGFAIIRKIFYL